MKEKALLAILAFSHLKSTLKMTILPLSLRFDIRHYLGRPFSSFLYSYHLWNMSTCYMWLSSHRKQIYGTRNAMPRKTCKFRLSRKIMKFYVSTRFRETIPTVQFVLSSEIYRINYGFLTEINNFVSKITILPLFQKLEFLGSYILPSLKGISSRNSRPSQSHTCMCNAHSTMHVN